MLNTIINMFYLGVPLQVGLLAVLRHNSFTTYHQRGTCRNPLRLLYVPVLINF